MILPTIFLALILGAVYLITMPSAPDTNSHLEDYNLIVNHIRLSSSHKELDKVTVMMLQFGAKWKSLLDKDEYDRCLNEFIQFKTIKRGQLNG